MQSIVKCHPECKRHYEEKCHYETLFRRRSIVIPKRHCPYHCHPEQRGGPFGKPQGDGDVFSDDGDVFSGDGGMLKGDGSGLRVTGKKSQVDIKEI